jgi:hypothetical protein
MRPPSRPCGGLFGPTRWKRRWRGRTPYLAFVLRAVQRVVGDDLRTEREKVNVLWSFLDDAELKKVLRIPKNARIRVRSRRGL